MTDIDKIAYSELIDILTRLDLEGFKKHYNKWQEFDGRYKNPLPADDVVMISMRQLACRFDEVPKATKDKARRWLKRHGYEV